MEKAIRGDAECMHLDYTKDVMGKDDGIQKRMGISVSGGDVNYGTKTHLFFQVMSRASASATAPLYRPVPWPDRLGGEPVGRKSGDGSAGKRSFHSGNVRSDSATEMDQRGGYGDHRDSL